MNPIDAQSILDERTYFNALLLFYFPSLFGLVKSILKPDTRIFYNLCYSCSFISNAKYSVVQSKRIPVCNLEYDLFGCEKMFLVYDL